MCLCFMLSYQVVGIITRINLAKYRAESKKGQLKLAELEIDDR